MSSFNLLDPNLPFEIPSGDEYSVKFRPDSSDYVVKVPNGELVYAERFFNARVSDRTVEYFQENDELEWRSVNWKELSAEQFAAVRFKNIKWAQDSIRLYGKTIPLPRLTSWYGDEDKVYTYSGITSQPNVWNKGLLYLKQKIEETAAFKFNSVLLNWYRDGRDHLNWHSDDERELGSNPTIASANFGKARDFVLRRKDDPQTKIIVPLKHGTLLLMRGELQHFWQHCVPKRTKVNGSRFNLTFRHITDT